MTHEAIRTCIDDMVTGLLRHPPVRPKTAQVNARPPGEQKSGDRQRDQYPVQRIDKVLKLHLRVVVAARWKRKQQDRADTMRTRKKSSAPMPALFSVRLDQSAATVQDTHHAPQSA